MTRLRTMCLVILPLLLAAPAGAQQLQEPQQQPPPTVTVTVASFSFTPKPIQLRAGEPTHLVFVNQSGSDHNFTAREFFASSRILSGSAPEGEIDLPGHATVAIDVVPAAGSYEAHCGHFMHKMLGMSDKIIVQ